MCDQTRNTVTECVLAPSTDQCRRATVHNQFWHNTKHSSAYFSSKEHFFRRCQILWEKQATKLVSLTKSGYLSFWGLDKQTLQVPKNKTHGHVEDTEQKEVFKNKKKTRGFRSALNCSRRPTKNDQNGEEPQPKHVTELKLKHGSSLCWHLSTQLHTQTQKTTFKISLGVMQHLAQLLQDGRTSKHPCCSPRRLFHFLLLLCPMPASLSHTHTPATDLYIVITSLVCLSLFSLYCQCGRWK